MSVFRCALLMLLMLIANLAEAQLQYRHTILIDSDESATSGCTVTQGAETFTGADVRVTAVVQGSPPRVVARELSTCAGGAFGAPQSSATNYAVGLNNGSAGSDVVELALTRAETQTSRGVVRIAAISQSSGGSVDTVFGVLQTVNGSFVTTIPTLSFYGTLILGLVLLGLAAVALKRSQRVAKALAIGGLLSVSLSVWAATIVLDGNVSDWSGITPLATDPNNDSQPASNGNDVLAVYGTTDTQSYYFRFDVRDAENASPVVVADTYTVLEDTLLTIAAPGVLANDSDPENSPLTAAVVSTTTRGTLNLAANGGFTYQPNPNLNGADVFTYAANDGQIASNGVATISVTPVNDVPSFVAGPAQNTLKDTGPQSIPNWATTISDGDPEVAQNLTFEIVSNSNPALFSAGPAVSATGTLTYTYAADQNGTATVTLRLRDDGGTANGGIDVSATQTLNFTATAVNDAPSFTVGANQTLAEDAPAVSVANWATNISPGPADEAGQTLTFIVQNNSNPTLFATAPAVSPTGTLTFTAAANANGVASITLVLRDNGGTANGGVDTSAPQTFTITVNAVNDAPVNTVPGAQQLQAAQTLVFNAANANLLSVADVDAGTALVQLTASVSAGSLTLANTAGLATISGQGTASVSATGTLAALNAALNGMSFLAPNSTVAVTLTLLSNDQGNTGTGGALSDSDTVAISVDAPPAVTAATPAAGATVANNQALSITFSEAINAAAGSVTLTCGGANLITGGTSASNVTSLTPTYAGTLPNGASCTLTVLAANITDVDTIDPPDAMAANVVRTFSVDAPPVQTVQTPPNGSTGVGLTASVGATFNEPIDATATAIEVQCNSVNIPLTQSAQTNVSSISVTPQTAWPAASTCQVFVFGTRIVDTDAIDPPDQFVGSSWSFTTLDTAPTVTSTVPVNGATGVGLANNIVVTFSEAVNFNVASFTLECPTLSPVGFTVTGSGTNTATLSLPTTLPSNTLCELRVVASGITDVDTVDPPNAMASDVNVSFTTVNDNPPSVSSTEVELGNVFTALPLGAGVGSDANTAVRVTFNEAVNPTANWAQLVCSVSGTYSVSSGLNVTVADPIFTLTPATQLSAGETCTLTVFAAQIADDDAIDPPDTMTANLVTAFAVDAAPAVSSTTPANNASAIATNSTITVNFSEAVNVGAGGVTLSCNSTAVAFSAGMPATNVSSLTLTPSAALPDSANCTGTVLAASVTDVDVSDPPNTLASNFVWAFTTVDTAPTVTSTVPADDALNVAPSSNITVNFSESVNFSASSFTLQCPSGSNAGFAVVTASPANSVVLNPTDADVAGELCELTVVAANVTDVDTIDPPNAMAADEVVTFTYSAVATADSYPVTPHLSLAFGGATGVLANDLVGTGTAVTGFGFAPACTGTAAGTQLDAGAANGRLTINANGSFSYEPPAGVANTTRTFCYTISGGATANVAFNLANTELVWFVDVTATAGGNGTQARPFQNLSGVSSVHTTADTVYLADGSYTSTFTLLANERLIGDGSTTGLALLTGITPVTGSSFPSLSGTAPVISCAGTCLTLGTDNTVRGITIGNSVIDVLGVNYGTLNMLQSTLTGTGKALDLNTGTANVTLIETTSSSSTTQNVVLTASAGSLNLGTGSLANSSAGSGAFVQSGTASISYSGTINKSTAGRLLDIGVGTGTIALSGDLSCATGCTGVLVNGRTAGSVTLSGASKNFDTGTSNGITLTANSGSSVSISNSTSLIATSGTAFAASGGGALTLNGTLDITVNPGRAVVIDGLTLAGSTTGAISSNGLVASNASAISIQNSAAASGLTLGQLLNLDHDDAGEGGGGIELQTNTGTYSFPNVTRIASGNRPALFTRNAGTLSVGQTVAGVAVGNNGPALDVRDTTVSTAGLNFSSVDSQLGTAGIILVNTGVNNALNVFGVGAPGAGGIIRAKTGANGAQFAGNGIVLDNVRGVSLRRVQLDTFDNFAVLGNAVEGFTLDNSVINGVSGNATSPAEGAVRFTGLTGSASFLSTTISGGIVDNIVIENSSGSLNPLTLTGSTVGLNSTANGDDGLRINSSGSASTTLRISNSFFTGARGDLLQVNLNGTSSADVQVLTTAFSNNHPNIVSGGGGVTLSGSGTGANNTLLYDVRSSTFRDAKGIALNVFKGNGAGTFTGTLDGNTIGVNGVALSGSSEASAIRVISSGTGAHTATITNNTLQQYNEAGLYFLAVDGNAGLKVTATGNTIRQPGTFAFGGVFADIGALPTDTHVACLALQNNTLNGSGPTVGDDVFYSVQASATLRVPGYTGPATGAGIPAFLAGLNSGLLSSEVTATAAAPGVFAGNAAGCP